MKNALGIISLAALLLAGCSGHAASSSAPIVPAPAQPAGSVTTVNFDEAGIDATGTLKVGIRLTGEASFNDPRYGQVLGYFKGKVSTTSQVVTWPMGRNVKFFNVDTAKPHTLSFLGNATSQNAPWPAHFNGSGTKSPAGTAIGTTNFSTGTLVPNQ